MRSAEAVTPMPNLIFPFFAFTFLYALLGVVTLSLLKMHVFDSPTLQQLDYATTSGEKHAA